jgi:hypothetical protein
VKAPRLDIVLATAIRHGVASCLLFVAAAALLFEEWLWGKSNAVAARLGKLPLLANVELWIRQLDRWAALALFVGPIVVIYPFKGLALYAMAHGYMIGGVTAFIVAKLVATALFARLYQLTEHAIIKFRGVRRTRAAFLRGRAFVHAWLDAFPRYRRARVAIWRHSRRVKRGYRVAYRLQRQRKGVTLRASVLGATRGGGGAHVHPAGLAGHGVTHRRWRPGAKRGRSGTS